MLRTMAWRDMTEHELATLPEARLGGALLWIVAAAVLLFVLAIAGMIMAWRQFGEIGVRYMTAVGFIAAKNSLLKIPVVCAVSGAQLTTKSASLVSFRSSFGRPT